MTEAAPAEQAVEAEKKKPLFHRIPTSLLVTLIGIVLTAWLLPAFTRQWDDRQKAQQVKSAVVTDMAQATADALTGGRRLLFHPVKGGSYAVMFDPPPGVSERWSKDSFRIEATVRAQLSGRVAELWHQYSVLVESLLVAASGLGDFSSGLQSTTYYTRVSPENPETRLPRKVLNGLPGFDKTLNDLNDLVYERIRTIRQVVKQRAAIKKMDLLLERGWSSPPEKALIAGGDLREKYARMAARLLKLEGTVAGHVQAAHVRGYSTTTGDLLHDLIP